jgi:HAD superfamily hydrolase (TIGR01509 family)
VNAAEPRVPYERIETVFLDVGNTLVSMNFAWIARELGARGLRCDGVALQRAEAAVRPSVSARCAGGAPTEGGAAFRFYLSEIVRRLPAAARLPDAALDALVLELAAVLREPGASHRLWTHVLDGVREALADLQRAGLMLVAVSNSDGSVETLLSEQKLRDPFRAVVDSGKIGVEKPDPRIFAHALERAGALPERTLHVGDLHGRCGRRTGGRAACRAPGSLRRLGRGRLRDSARSSRRGERSAARALSVPLRARRRSGRSGSPARTSAGSWAGAR